MPAASINAYFGLDISPLQRALASAESVAKSSASKIQSSLNSVSTSGMGSRINWDRLTRERAQSVEYLTKPQFRTGANFLAAPPGKYKLPADQEKEGGTGRMGFPQGVGRALTLVAGVSALAESYERANQQAGDLRRTIAQITELTGNPAFFAGDEAMSRLKLAGTTLNEIYKRDAIERQGFLGAYERTKRHIFTGVSGADDEAQKNELRSAAVKNISDLAEKQQALNEAEQEGFSGSQRKSELLKSEIQHREKLGALAAEEAAAGVTNPAGRNAENARFGIENDVINKRFDLKEREEEVENRILNLQGSSLTKDQQALAALRERISLLKQRLGQTGTVEEKTRIGTEIHGLENQQVESQYRQRFQGPALFTPENAEQNRLSSFVRTLSPSGPNTYLTSPDAYKRSPDAYGAPDDLTPPTGRPYQTPSFSSNLGSLNQHMESFGGSQSFNDWFHPAKGGGVSKGAKGAAGADIHGGKESGVVQAIEKLGNKIEKIWAD